ncbi:MAG: T9SS type A sorting domain-containing protein [Lewinellaceae bacterium]|nr:T9SS type A sorting domain-containing protein [Phaeodactylibacter sp.]MCB9036818.1 T9SS type A sorting domain-containing protein [Lewinellaceae bacterium]
MKQIIILPALFALCGLALHAQLPCVDTANFLSLTIEIRTDQFGNETSWLVTDSDGNIYGIAGNGAYANNNLYSEGLCIPDSTCITVSILDSYGDGIFFPGYARIILEGDTLFSTGNFGSGYTLEFNCGPGQSCDMAIPVDTGQYLATYDDTWYIFTPDSVGLYSVSTCGLNECDTKIWIYDSCEGVFVTEDNTGTIFYNDDENDCAPQAVVSTFLDTATTYLIRIGDNADACPDSIWWEIVYEGPVTGCTDPASCNYNPLASVDDGSCLPQGDPDCPDAPDLLVRQDILINSLHLDTIESTDPCLIEEGCLQGYGKRDIIRFTTWIENIGQLDYFIGQPSYDNAQFTWNNCHNHFHYDGYAEYLLFTENGTEIPIGFKNGFCVLDLGCNTGNAKYGCGNMGISAGCYDIYGASLPCQWVDVTDIPDGAYTFISRINWDNAPDKLGHIERDTLNNWAQACIILDRSSGQLEMTVVEDCAPYIDCEGTPFGNVRLDCNGECGGLALHGDIDQNGQQEIMDSRQYAVQILAGDITPAPCNDLNADGAITVYDAALLASCINFGTAHQHQGNGVHNHCNFPSGVYNSNDTVSLSILEANFDSSYIDIGIHNPRSKVNGYQFKMSGLNIMRVDNLMDPAAYPMDPSGNGQQVIGLSYEDSLIQKNSEFVPLCRIYYAGEPENLICIDEIIDIVNENQEQTATRIAGGCVEYSPVSAAGDLTRQLQAQLFPNPFRQQTRLVFDNPNGEVFRLEVAAMNGQRVRTYEGITGSEILIDGTALPEGIYWYKLIGNKGFAAGKMSVQR